MISRDIRMYCGRFVGPSLTVHGWSPCFIKRREERERKTEKFYIYSDVTHTHAPGRSLVNNERQEEGKSGHRRRAKGQNSAGGKGTNGPPEPTYAAKRT